ncbi:MAG: hypothetical protein NT075_26155 [Chloroflexi bacterium]|nr:hypothetical protein [Chloroflexota bacterium]
MAILLFSDAQTVSEQAPQFIQGRLPVLLMTGESPLAAPLQAALDDLLVVDVQGPRLSRLNFDAVDLAIVDLAPELLLSSGGRRLIDVLGNLASDPDQALHLAFYGPSLAVIGGFLDDGATAGLNLIPGTVVLPDVQAVTDLRALLARMSDAGLRLLALDRPVGARYEPLADTIAVRGQGSLLLTAFRQNPGDERPTARLHVLTDSMTSGWPV